MHMPRFVKFSSCVEFFSINFHFLTTNESISPYIYSKKLTSHKKNQVRTKGILLRSVKETKVC